MFKSSYNHFIHCHCSILGLKFIFCFSSLHSCFSTLVSSEYISQSVDSFFVTSVHSPQRKDTLQLVGNFLFLTRYKYENNRVMDASSSDISSPLQYQLYGNGNGNGNIGGDVPLRGTQNQLLERQVSCLYLHIIFFCI